VVNDDAQAKGLLPADASLLELAKGEATALADLAVVADGRCTDGRAEFRERANTKGSGLGGTSIAAAELAARLVKPGAYPALPVLAEMVAGENYGMCSEIV
jgi:hypothetical protein